MLVKSAPRTASPGTLAGQRRARWRLATRAAVAVAVQGILAGALLLAGSAWANETPAGHHAPAATGHGHHP